MACIGVSTGAESSACFHDSRCVSVATSVRALPRASNSTPIRTLRFSSLAAANVVSRSISFSVPWGSVMSVPSLTCGTTGKSSAGSETMV